MWVARYLARRYRLVVSAELILARIDKMFPHLSGDLLARLREYQEMIEEFKVSLFAQELGTALPVSAKRLDKKWQEIDQLC